VPELMGLKEEEKKQEIKIESNIDVQKL